MVKSDLDLDITQQLHFLQTKALEDLNLDLTEEQLAKVSLYVELLLERNEKVNLTAITNPRDIMIKHFLDSLVFVKWIKRFYQQKRVVVGDLGTGAGFPGIPINIALPEVKVVLIDALAKRINFLNEVKFQLNLPEIETCHARAEDIGRKSEYREVFNVVVARAVAELPVLLEYSIPLLKVGGRLIAAKGVDPEKEIRSAQKAFQVLNCEYEHLDKYKLAEGADHRSLIIIKKIGHTPAKYPRQAGKPKKDPL